MVTRRVPALLCSGLQEVLRKVPSNQLHTFLEPQDESGWTPLMVAAAKGYTGATHEVREVVHTSLLREHSLAAPDQLGSVFESCRTVPCLVLYAVAEGRRTSSPCEQRPTQHSPA